MWGMNYAAIPANVNIRIGAISFIEEDRFEGGIAYGQTIEANPIIDKASQP